MNRTLSNACGIAAHVFHVRGHGLKHEPTAFPRLRSLNQPVMDLPYYCEYWSWCHGMPIPNAVCVPNALSTPPGLRAGNDMDVRFDPWIESPWRTFGDNNYADDAQSIDNAVNESTPVDAQRTDIHARDDHDSPPPPPEKPPTEMAVVMSKAYSEGKCMNVCAWQCSEQKCKRHCADPQCPRHNSDYAKYILNLYRWERAPRRRGGCKRHDNTSASSSAGMTCTTSTATMAFQ